VPKRREEERSTIERGGVVRMASGTAEKQATAATTGTREDQGGREASVNSGDHHPSLSTVRSRR
jgi:hypothetical protein